MEQMEEDIILPIIKGPIEILKDNGMWPCDQGFTKGRSIDDPIVIKGVREYVRMEYRVLNLLYRWKKSEFLIQGLCEKDDRKIDCMLMKITDSDGNNEHTEKVYFDITEGFNSL